MDLPEGVIAPFHFPTRVAMQQFGLEPDEIYVSRNQPRPNGTRGTNEATYYQTSDERYVSFVPSDLASGQVCGEAYLGYATEASDGAGGIGCTAMGRGKVIANLRSGRPAVSDWAMREIATPPDHYLLEPEFYAACPPYYRKGF